MDNKILLTNIQRFSLNDGPGIRTTVFLKGCSLRCPWCSNPENISLQPQTYSFKGKSGIYGEYMSADELVNECIKDVVFYKGSLNCKEWNIKETKQIDLLPGGVTFSGGECILQMNKLVPVCKSLHDKGVHIAVETCLFVPDTLLSIALENVDFFYVDMKILDKERCKDIEKGNLDQYLSNLSTIMNSDTPIAIRVPVIGSYTDDMENRMAVKALIEKYKSNILKIELIKEHNLGEDKYNSLGIKMNYKGVDDALMEKYKEELDGLGMPVEVCRI